MSDDRGAGTHAGRGSGEDPARGGLVTVRLFGFPVTLHTSFLVIVGILGFYPGQTLRDWAIWMIVATLAILVHELGHAFSARATGASPAVALVGLGGVTTFVPRGPHRRWVSIGISAAGPGIGLAVGAGLWVLGHTLVLDAASWQATVLFYGLFTTVVWSVLNLLPVLPLDGGHILEDLLPGDPVTRARRAAMVSIVVALVASAVALSIGYTFFGVFAALLILTNVLALRSPREPRADGGGATEEVQGIVDLVVQGRPDEARAALEALSARQEQLGGPPVDLAVHGLVLAASGEREQGLALLVQEVRNRPGDETAVRLLALAHLVLREPDQIGAMLAGPFARSVGADLVLAAQTQARGRQDEALAARLGETFLEPVLRSGPRWVPEQTRPLIARVAVETARSSAATGAVGTALEYLEIAVTWGFSDLKGIAVDPAFASVRVRPEFGRLLAEQSRSARPT